MEGFVYEHYCAIAVGSIFLCNVHNSVSEIVSKQPRDLVVGANLLKVASSTGRDSNRNKCNRCIFTVDAANSLQLSELINIHFVNLAAATNSHDMYQNHSAAEVTK